MLTVLCVATAMAQNYPYKYYFRHINHDNGLSQCDVKAIIQDSYGFMWFGTRNKLNRYDGIRMKVMDVIDYKTGHSNNNISSLYEDKERHLWVGTDKGVFIYDPMQESFSFLGQKTAKGVTMTDWVAQIEEDQQGNIWISVPNQGLFCYNKSKNSLVQYQLGQQMRPDYGSPQCMVIDKSGKLWVGTDRNGVWLYNRSNNRFEQYLGDNGNASSTRDENIYRMCDFGDYLILGIHDGKLRKLNKRTNTVSDVNAPDVHYKIIRDVKCYDGMLWVGTQDGVYIVNGTTGQTEHIFHDPMCGYSLNDNQIGRIYRDRENGIWVGTNMDGINYLPRTGMQFMRYVPLSTDQSITSRRVRELGEDKDGNIWIGTDNAGVDVFNPHTGTFNHLSNLFSNNTLSLKVFDNKVWIGYFKNGIDIIGGGKTHLSGEQIGLNEPSVYAMCLDSRGNVWIGNGWCVYVKYNGSDSFTKLPQFEDNYIYDIIEDDEHEIWIATMGRGVFRHNPTSGKTVHYTHKDNDTTSLSSNSVSGVMQATNGKIWFSTDRGGVCCFDKESNKFTTYSKSQGLPGETAYKILEDKNGYLWFGTDDGLVKFNPKDGKCKVFTTDNGLPSNQFNYKSALSASSGIFYFGCSEGLISFNPNDNRLNHYVPPVYITKMIINGREITPQDEDTPLAQSIVHTKKVSLSHDQSSISFEFAALSYAMPEANSYSYMMEGVSDEWTTTTESHSVTYANLSPGKYIFHVKGSNSDGVWNDKETTITVTIHQPWWNSIWAWLVYLPLLAAAGWWTYRRLRLIGIRKAREKQRLFENEKERELYRNKIDFFTSIAHEIRTPVTLINGPLESLMDMDIADPDIKRNLNTMNRNTNELMDLINQLLDFRKVDSNSVDVNPVTINLGAMLTDWVGKFTDSAHNAGKTISYTAPESDLYVRADRKSLIKIFNNLFSNAIRYGQKEISITVTKNGTNTVFAISNDGDTIPEEKQPKIFDAFYQVQNNANIGSSSGIGLYLAKSLAELNDGSLSYSIVDGLNTFTLTLKSVNFDKSEQTEDSETAEFIDTNYDNEDIEQQNKTVLFVDDNEELLNFVADKLRQHYNVVTASNGVKALEILKENNINIVISDIMMPEMDGLELCQHIKEDIELSHIPVVLLTAKNDLDSKVKGLKTGADAYIEKPFSFKYLIAQLTAIFDNKRRETEAFKRKPFVPSENMGMSKADEQLMNKIIEAIENNIDNPNFGVEMLADLACLSRSSLHRKIKAISGSSPTDFIRLIRLKKASKLIAEGNYRTGEVCYIVGINSPSYFIKLFQKQFNMTPKEFERQVRQGNIHTSEE